MRKIANELIKNHYKLYYWQSDGIAVIDFLIYTNNGIIPIEVKSSDNTKSKSLKTYMEKYKLDYGIRISSKKGIMKKQKLKLFLCMQYFVSKIN